MTNACPDHPTFDCTAPAPPATDPAHDFAAAFALPPSRARAIRDAYEADLLALADSAGH